ncbi:lipocalin family protein [Chryseobacterium sp. Tr-659]|uniref:lipocalin family protein n=1 Tax=Chryseobacterium sp. Tr-659 TaxID=2608340 RepID=UPI0014240082|nr:lipocalin family protein [Chryseobacterium sp. Tr-659]NIF03833.1 lipocalin family protein [Chryseobacterium sp. Tr-659]
MKKLALLFGGLSLLVAAGCNNDNDTVIESPLIGNWQPLKEVVTTVEVGEDPVSNTITYTDCQKKSRWLFSIESKGTRTDWGDTATPGQCAILSDKKFNYTYDKDAKTVQLKYQGTVEPVNGKIITLDDTSLNLSVREETQDPKIYQTRTYTFKRITQ